MLQHKRGPKVISFKKRRRKNSRRKRSYRMTEITVLRITEILTNDNKPTIGPRPKREKPVVAAPVDGDDEAPKGGQKKAPAKKAGGESRGKTARQARCQKGSGQRRPPPKNKSDKK